MKQFYQGDIPIIEITSEDKRVNYQPFSGELVIREGEVTGHKHILRTKEKSKIEVAKDDFGYFLKITEGEAELVHEDHKTQTFGVGVYFIGEQIEYSDLEDRKVQD